MEPFDTSRPNIARVWDYWLGGKENFAADRELAEKMLAIHPVTAQMARENRQFLGRAVSYVAGRGIGSALIALRMAQSSRSLRWGFSSRGGG